MGLIHRSYGLYTYGTINPTYNPIIKLFIDIDVIYVARRFITKRGKNKYYFVYRYQC